MEIRHFIDPYTLGEFKALDIYPLDLPKNKKYIYFEGD